MVMYSIVLLGSYNLRFGVLFYVNCYSGVDVQFDLVIRFLLDGMLLSCSSSCSDLCKLHEPGG